MSYISCWNGSVLVQIILWITFLSSGSSTPMQELSTPTVIVPTQTKLSSEQSRIQARISLPRPVRVAFGDGSIWISDSVEFHILRLDASTGKTIGSPIALDFVPREIAYGEGAVWVCSVDHSRLARIDPQTNKVIAEADLRPLQIPDHIYVLLAIMARRQVTMALRASLKKKNKLSKRFTPAMPRPANIIQSTSARDRCGLWWILRNQPFYKSAREDHYGCSNRAQLHKIVKIIYQDTLISIPKAAALIG